jgi:hypothetical protein
MFRGIEWNLKLQNGEHIWPISHEAGTEYSGTASEVCSY